MDRHAQGELGAAGGGGLEDGRHCDQHAAHRSVRVVARQRALSSWHRNTIMASGGSPTTTRVRRRPYARECTT
eukprot:scaffold23372_cov66-Phaeocystis_antarctica.AAC.4